jgi:hypothetical protein
MTKDEALKLALEALELLCVKCRSNEWGPNTPRKEILNWMHDHASKAHTAIEEALACNGLGLAMGLNDADFAVYQRGYDKGRAEGLKAGKKPSIPEPQPPQPDNAEKVLDWLAQQHWEQCREDRPVQHWIRSMKTQLPIEEKST